MKTTLVLTGAYAGQTIRLGSHQFTSGKIVLEGAPHELDSAINVLGRGYQAFMAGSDELESAQKRDVLAKEIADGVRSGIDKTTQPGNPVRIPSHVDGAPRPVQEVRPVQLDRSQPALPAAGDKGLVSDGSGQPGSGLHPEQVAKIKVALAKLDPTVATHWSENGLPSIEVLAQITGDQSITRAVVNAVAPEFTQSVATAASL